MKSTLAIEWLKLKKYRTFWILLGFFIVLLPLWNYEIENGVIKMGGGNINILDQQYSFPDVWGNVGYWGSIFIIFLSILIIIITTNEFSFKTHRQNVIDGWSRLQFYHAKVGMVIILSIIATIYLFIMGALFGTVHSGSASGMFENINQVGYFFLLSLNYLGFAMFIALWIRRSGLSIGLFLIYAIILELILQATINWFSQSHVGNFLPLQASDELLPFPLMKMAKHFIPGPAPAMSTYVIVTVGWCLVYYLGGRWMMLKRDW